MYTKVVIEDLQLKSKIDARDTSEYRMFQERIKASQKLSEAKLRDNDVWSKTKHDKQSLKTHKLLWRAYMLDKYPEFTRKSDFHTQKAIIWS